MSTAVVSNEATSTDVAIKPDNVTYHVFVKTDAEGKVQPKETVYTSSEKQVEKYAAADSGYTLAKSQTLRTYKVGTVEGFVELINDNEEAINIINRGVAQKTNQKINDFLTSFDETTQQFTNPESEDVIDTRDMLQEPTQRRNLSTTDKVIRALKAIPGVDNDKIMQILAQLQTATAPATV